MIGPIGVKHANFRHGRVALLVPFEIILDMNKITEGHGQIERVIECLKLCLRHIDKAVKNSDILRLLKALYQRFGLFKACLTGIHRIDTMLFNRGKLLLADIPLDGIGNCRADHRLLIFI